MFDFGTVVGPSPPKGLTSGWLIELRPARHDFGNLGDSSRRFLQIGTGQWCGAQYATLFPLRRTAVTYAREFGLLVDREVQIVAYES